MQHVAHSSVDEGSAIDAFGDAVCLVDVTEHMELQLRQP